MAASPAIPAASTRLLGVPRGASPERDPRPPSATGPSSTTPMSAATRTTSASATCARPTTCCATRSGACSTMPRAWTPSASGERARFQAFVSRGRAGLARSARQLPAHAPDRRRRRLGPGLAADRNAGLRSAAGRRRNCGTRWPGSRRSCATRTRRCRRGRAAAGEGGEVVYASALSFPAGSAELAGELQASVDREAATSCCRPSPSLPEAAAWRLAGGQLQRRAPPARPASPSMPGSWRCCRVASVTEYLIQAAVSRRGAIAVRFLAGLCRARGRRRQRISS